MTRLTNVPFFSVVCKRLLTLVFVKPLPNCQPFCQVESHFSFLLSVRGETIFQSIKMYIMNIFMNSMLYKQIFLFSKNSNIMYRDVYVCCLDGGCKQSETLAVSPEKSPNFSVCLVSVAGLNFIIAVSSTLLNIVIWDSVYYSSRFPAFQSFKKYIPRLLAEQLWRCKIMCNALQCDKLFHVFFIHLHTPSDSCSYFEEEVKRFYDIDNMKKF